MIYSNCIKCGRSRPNLLLDGGLCSFCYEGEQKKGGDETCSTEKTVCANHANTVQHPSSNAGDSENATASPAAYPPVEPPEDPRAIAVIKQMQTKMDTLQSQLRETQAACAVMRTALKKVWEDYEMGWLIYNGKTVCVRCGAKAKGENGCEIFHTDDCIQGMLDKALSLTAGKEILERVARLEEMVSGLDNTATAPVVLWFAKRMEAKLAKNRHKGDRVGWLNSDPVALLKRIQGEWKELEEAMASGHAEDITNECADVANFAMMVADWFSQRATLTPTKKAGV